MPNHAFAKIDFRLVPNLSPDLVLDLLKKHLARRGFDDIEVILTETGEETARSPFDPPSCASAVDAASSVRDRADRLSDDGGQWSDVSIVSGLGIPAVARDAAGTIRAVTRRTKAFASRIILRGYHLSAS